MTQQQLRDLVKASNPVSRPESLLPAERDVRTLYAEAMRRAGTPPVSDGLLEQPVERRPDMQTREKPIQVVREPHAGRPRRRLVPALAGAMAVLVIGAGVWALTRDTESEFAGGSPLEVIALLDEEAVTADWSGSATYYTADATYQLVGVSGESPEIRFADELPETARVDDWDGDGRLTEMDGFIALGAEVYAGGTTKLLSCTQPDAATVVCEEVREGFAFENPDHAATWTLTFVDGLIDRIVIAFGPGEGTDSSALRIYTGWVRVNHPDEAAELVNEFTGAWKLTPDTIERHRELVAEWMAQR